MTLFSKQFISIAWAQVKKTVTDRFRVDGMINDAFAGFMPAPARTPQQAPVPADEAWRMAFMADRILPDYIPSPKVVQKILHDKEIARGGGTPVIELAERRALQAAEVDVRQRMLNCDVIHAAHWQEPDEKPVAQAWLNSVRRLPDVEARLQTLWDTGYLAPENSNTLRYIVKEWPTQLRLLPGEKQMDTIRRYARERTDYRSPLQQMLTNEWLRLVMPLPPDRQKQEALKIAAIDRRSALKDTAEDFLAGPAPGAIPPMRHIRLQR